MESSEQKKNVLSWLSKAPFDNPQAIAAHPRFSYEEWLQEGRNLPHVVDLLMEILAEDLIKPTENGEKAAFALGRMGDRRAVKVLLRATEGRDTGRRSEAVASLGLLGDSSAADTLEKLAEDEREDVNVRANACVAIGRLASPRADAILNKMLKDRDPFLARSAAVGLRLLKERQDSK